MGISHNYSINLSCSSIPCGIGFSPGGGVKCTVHTSYTGCCKAVIISRYPVQLERGPTRRGGSSLSSLAFWAEVGTVEWCGVRVLRWEFKRSIQSWMYADLNYEFPWRRCTGTADDDNRNGFKRSNAEMYTDTRNPFPNDEWDTFSHVCIAWKIWTSAAGPSISEKRFVRKSSTAHI